MQTRQWKRDHEDKTAWLILTLGLRLQLDSDWVEELFGSLVWFLCGLWLGWNQCFHDRLGSEAAQSSLFTLGWVGTDQVWSLEGSVSGSIWADFANLGLLRREQP